MALWAHYKIKHYYKSKLIHEIHIHMTLVTMDKKQKRDDRLGGKEEVEWEVSNQSRDANE